MNQEGPSGEIFDVAIVGAGPAGMMLAILLGQQGHKVILVDRHPGPYPLPRAITFDDEVARILSTIGIDADHDPQIESFDEMVEFHNQNGDLIALLDWRGVTRLGRNRLYWFYQPELEQRLSAVMEKYPSIDVRRNIEITGFTQNSTEVRMEGFHRDSKAPLSFKSRYLVGADGANSLVRSVADLPLHETGFEFDWLVVDLRMKSPGAIRPAMFQHCDPARPATVVPGGPGRRRWEFMLMPGETAEQMDREEVAWALLKPWNVTPEVGTLERHAVWRFKGRWATEWRRGRVLIAGDAAHLSPPFAGQGMCAAIRDSFNLGWKLDAVLRGLASDTLLSSYCEERKVHVQRFIDLAIGFGRAICITDPVEAADRDFQMMAALKQSGPQPPVDPDLGLGEGVWLQGQPFAGKIVSHGRVSLDGRAGPFDALVGTGWLAIGNGFDPANLLSPGERQDFEWIGGRYVTIGSEDCPGQIQDLQNVFHEMFLKENIDVLLVRPDFYIAAASKMNQFPSDMRRVLEKYGLSASEVKQPFNVLSK